MSELSVTLFSDCGGRADATAEFSVEEMAVTTHVPVDVLWRGQETDITPCGSDGITLQYYPLY